MNFIAAGLMLLIARDVISQQKEGDSCFEEHSIIEGRCVPLEMCETAVGEYLLNSTQRTPCDQTSVPLVCCTRCSGAQEAASSRNAKATSTWKVDNSTNRRRISERKCKEYSRLQEEKLFYIPLLPDPETSVVSPACDADVILIVGGSHANFGEFPHMAAVGWLNDEGGYTFLCGGSLISPKFVLTAGQCSNYPRAKNPKPAIVRLGDLNLDPSVDDGADTIEVPIKAVHKHPDFKPPKMDNDIALLELAAEVSFTNSIRPACLWSEPDFGNLTKALVTGWGVKESPNGQPSKALQKMTVSLISNQQCDQMIEKKINWFGLSSTQMCATAANGGREYCLGDSGAPLQVAAAGNQCVFRVLGVTSFGRRCAQSGRPAVYTRVAAYLDWIESVVWPEH